MSTDRRLHPGDEVELIHIPKDSGAEKIGTVKSFIHNDEVEVEFSGGVVLLINIGHLKRLDR